MDCYSSEDTAVEISSLPWHAHREVTRVLVSDISCLVLVIYPDFRKLVVKEQVTCSPFFSDVSGK